MDAIELWEMKIPLPIKVLLWFPCKMQFSKVNSQKLFSEKGVKFIFNLSNLHDGPIFDPGLWNQVPEALQTIESNKFCPLMYQGAFLVFKIIKIWFIYLKNV